MKKMKEKENDSLFITVDLCIEYHACAIGIEYMQKKYPQGFYAKDVINRKVKMPLFFIHWASTHLPLTPSDIKGYFKMVEIKESSDIKYSQKIIKSSNISDSKSVTNSKGVYHGVEILNSTDIVDSTKVDFSKQIYKSKNITMSEYVSNSTSIAYANHIFLSTNISYSSYVYNSIDVANGIGISNSSNVEMAMFSQNLTNCKNKLFCQDLTDDNEYKIFNIKVSEQAFIESVAAVNNALKDIKINSYQVFILLESVKQTDLFLSILGNKIFKGTSFWQDVKDNIIFSPFMADELYSLFYDSELYEVI